MRVPVSKTNGLTYWLDVVFDFKMMKKHALDNNARNQQAPMDLSQTGAPNKKYDPSAALITHIAISNRRLCGIFKLDLSRINRNGVKDKDKSTR